MQTVTFDISQEAFGYVQGKGFISPVEYFRMKLADDMLVDHTEEVELEALHKLLDEGHNSGYVTVDDEYFRQMDIRFDEIKRGHFEKQKQL